MQPYSVRRLSRAIVVGGIVLTLVATSALAAAQRNRNAANAELIYELTYLKAKPGEVDRLATFIQRNWFEMDSRATAAGHMQGYRLLRGSPADSSWDLLEISVYADSAQHARIASLFRVVYRPAHTTVLVDGRSFRELGTIVASVTTRWAGGLP
jgi:hypothetical protein